MTHWLIESCEGDSTQTCGAYAVDASRRAARDVFLAAIKLPAEERVAYVREACGDDQDLQRRVSALLGAQAEIGTFLETPPTVGSLSTETSGAVIGLYK